MGTVSPTADVDRDLEKPGFAILPKAEDVVAAIARYDGKLPSVDLEAVVAVLWLVMEHFDGSREGWVKQTTIAKVLRKSEGHVRRTVKLLVDTGCLVRVGPHLIGHRKVANVYRLGPSLRLPDPQSAHGSAVLERAPVRGPLGVPNEEYPKVKDLKGDAEASPRGPSLSSSKAPRLLTYADKSSKNDKSPNWREWNALVAAIAAAGLEPPKTGELAGMANAVAWTVAIHGGDDLDWWAWGVVDEKRGCDDCRWADAAMTALGLEPYEYAQVAWRR